MFFIYVWEILYKALVPLSLWHLSTMYLLMGKFSVLYKQCCFNWEMMLLVECLCLLGYLFGQIFITHYKWVKIPGPKFERIAVILTWGCTTAFMIMGWAIYYITKVPYYTPVGFNSWCWVSESYPIERITFTYGWLILFSIVLFFLYFHIIITLRHKKSPILTRNEMKIQKIVMKLIGFPVIYFFVFVPLGLDRIIGMISSEKVQFPNEYAAFSCCLLVSNGFMNAMLYGYTRKIGQKVRSKGVYRDLDQSSVNSQSKSTSMKIKGSSDVN